MLGISVSNLKKIGSLIIFIFEKNLEKKLDALIIYTL